MSYDLVLKLFFWKKYLRVPWIVHGTTIISAKHWIAHFRVFQTHTKIDVQRKRKKKLYKILNAKYYNWRALQINIYISKFFILKKKINTTNWEVKVDTCPLPRWTLKNYLFWKMQLQIVIHVYLYHRWAFVYKARISSGRWGTESFRIEVSIYVNKTKNKQNKTKYDIYRPFLLGISKLN